MDTIKINDGGRPITNNDLQNFYTDAGVALKGLGISLNNTGKPMILWGMTNVGSGVSEGAIIGPDGEIYYHTDNGYGGWDPDIFLLDFVETDEDSRVYYDGNTKYTHKTRRAILRTTTTSGWSAVTYTEADAGRIYDKLYHLLNNKMFFNVGDIYTSDSNGLQLQSNYSVTGDTVINKYEGDVTIGSVRPILSAYDVTLNGQVKMIDDYTYMIEGAMSFLSGSYTIGALGYDRLIYAFAEWATNDFTFDCYIGSTKVTRCGAELGTQFILPANIVGTITVTGGHADSFYMWAQKFGNVS